MSRRQGIIRWWYWLHFSTLVVILPTIAAATRLSRDVDLGASKDSQGPTSKVRTIVVDLATATRKVRKERTEHLVEEHHLHPSDRGVREWIVLKKLYDAVEGTEEMQTEGHWLDENYNLCMWRGITCGPDKSDLIEMEKGGVTVPADAITKIVLVHEELQGTLPTELGMLEFLTRLELQYNELHGSIPDNYSYIPRLRLIDLSHNDLSGSIPETLGTHSTRLEGIHIADNHLIGQIPPNLVAWSNLRHFDVSNNVLTGTIPDALFELKNLKYLVAADNWISGELPSRIANLSSLRLLDLGSMLLCGPLPSNINQLKSLQDLNLGDNRFTGALPSEIWDLSELQTFLASNNQFTGTLPTSAKEVGWHELTNLSVLRLDNNRLTGSIPRDLFVGLKASLQWLDLSYNRLSGTIATEIGQMIRLRTIDVMANMISGSLPDEMLEMNMNLRLNFTNNLLTGTIPGLFCGEGAISMNMLYGEFGCDAVLCRPGTFNNHGHATLHSACRECPEATADPALRQILGRTSCRGLEIVHGDLDGDGVLSDREILRMIYIDTLGRFWGAEFQPWGDITFHECALKGITCRTGEVTVIDLTHANMCSDGDRNPGPIQFCNGIPREIGQLSSLEELHISRRQFLRGTIPTEIGMLSNLKHLDLSSSPVMSGTLPSEIGLLTKLSVLMLSHGRFTGTVPFQIYNLPSLQYLHLTNNDFSGTLPNDLGMNSLIEFMVSQNSFSGTLPTELGSLMKMTNLELSSNNFSGTIPKEVSESASLLRIDLFNNLLSGPLPESFPGNLQIFHAKDNQLTGTIPMSMGLLPYLIWLDLSENLFHGTVPSTFGSNRSIRDLHLGQNFLYDPLPRGLCSNPNINNGSTSKYGCDAILCALGSYSTLGFASDAEGCTECPPGELTCYLGSNSCFSLTEQDFLVILYETMQGNLWPESLRENWRDIDIDHCNWGGLSCDSAGKLTSLTLPLIGSEGVL